MLTYRRSRSTLGLMSGSAAIALLIGVPALAQAQADSKPDTAGTPVLEEIVVTQDRQNSYSADLVQAGSFRGARQLDTPLTINVIPNEVLLSQQASGLLDALRTTAGVTQSQTSTVVYNNLSIRGISVDNRGNYRLDGALPVINLTDLPLEDKDRVEALKGASALYYGFTTPSGIINMTMKRPTDTPLVEVTTFGDSHGSAGGHLDIGGTYGMFGYRVNAVDTTIDTGITYAQGHRNLLSGAFDLKPLDSVTLSLDYEHIHKRIVEPGIFQYKTVPAPTVANPYPAISLPSLLDPSTNFGPAWGYNSTNEDNLLLKGDWKITDSWAATVYAGQSQMARDRNFSTFNPTNLATGAGTLALSRQNAQYQNQNIRGEVAGTFYTGPFLHEILIGAQDNVRDQLSPTSAAALCAPAKAGGAQVACPQNIFDPIVVPLPTIAPATSGTTTRISDIGEYVFDRVKFQDWLELLGGMRNSNYAELNLNPKVTTFRDVLQSYSGGVVLKPFDWISGYGTYIEGLESTPAAPFTAANAGAQLPASESTQYEGGIKIEPKRGLLFQAAYFSIDRASTYVNSANVYVQDGRATYQGEEISLTGEVTSDLSIYASFMNLKAIQQSGAPTIITTNAKTGAVTVSPSAVGKSIDNTPAQTFSLSGEYRLSDWVPGLAVTAGGYYVGRRALNPLNQAWVPSYTLYNLGASYLADIDNHAITFRVNAENVGNTRYWAATGSLLLAEGPPSTVKFSISTEF